MKEEDFEILLSRLAWEDISEGERVGLESETAGSPERAERLRRFEETLDVLKGFDGADLEIPELEEQYFGPGAGETSGADKTEQSAGKVRRVNFTRAALPAAAALLLAAGAWIFLGRSAPAVETHLTHASGECRAGEGKLNKGAKFEHFEVSSGANSICDVRIAYAGKLHLRLLANSRFSYTVQNHSLTIKLEQGELLLDSEKLPARGFLRIHSPGHSIEVLGTRLALNRREGHKLNMDLIRGRARVKSAHYLRLHGLRNGVHAKHRIRLAREFPELFGSTEHILEPGKGLRFEHPRDFHEHTAPLFRSLEKHLKDAKGASDHTGAHHVDRKLTARLRAAFQSHPAAGHAHFSAPPRGKSETVSAERAARLRAHFDAISKRSGVRR